MFVPITRGILQGQQRFFALGGSMLYEAILKVGVSFLLVYLGFGVLGAIGGVVISLILSFGISLIYIRKILRSKSEFAELGGIKTYSKPVFLITLVLILFLNIDLLLAGYFFNDFESGVYAIASTIALIIFIGIQPINKVLFPITANESAEKKISKQNFVRAITIITLMCIVALSVIIAFTDDVIYILSNKILPQAVVPTILLSFGTTFLSLSSTILYYKLSKGNIHGYKYVFLFLLLEVILLTVFSSSVLTYSYAFLLSNIIFFIGSVVLLRK
jgi:O-antigen/teichoic acid export membrane protein